MRNKIALVLLILTTLVMIGCSSGDKNYVENNLDSTSSGLSTAELAALIQIPVLFGVGDTEYVDAQYKSDVIGGTSSLYWINTTNGSAAKIGDIGYSVNGIAYDSVTKKLYGITSNLLPGVSGNYKGPSVFIGSQIIEINIATGAGTIIGEISLNKDDSNLYFSNPTFNSSGTLFAWNNTDNTLCTIDLTNGMANPVGIPIFGLSQYFGLAFDNSNVLYLIDGNNKKGAAIGADVYMLDTSGGLASFVKTITGLPNDMAYNGDFDPITGKYWGLGTPDYVFDASVKKEYTQDLLVIDIGNGTLLNTIPTINNLRAITFGYVDPITLASNEMVSLCNYLKDLLNPPN